MNRTRRVPCPHQSSSGEDLFLRPLLRHTSYKVPRTGSAYGLTAFGRRALHRFEELFGEDLPQWEDLDELDGSEDWDDR